MAVGDSSDPPVRVGHTKKDEELRKDIRELLSKLNPMAKEFIPPSVANGGGGFGPKPSFLLGQEIMATGRRMTNVVKLGYDRQRRMNSRTIAAQREEVIRRTVHVSDIDHQVTEEKLATLFNSCGQVVDCRICGDPNSVLRFAFIEFTHEVGARAALHLSGTVLGFYPVKVLPSKTAIAPVDPKFLPKSEDEREMCTRTVYCTNIDKKVPQNFVKHFFESICGQVRRFRLLGDHNHATNIAFVEFARAEDAIRALNCSGSVLGDMPLRISPSKTPVRPRAPRQPFN